MKHVVIASLLTLGLVAWVFMLWRVLRKRLKLSLRSR